MPKKKFFYLFFLFFLFYIGSVYLLPQKEKEFAAISNKIYDNREKSLAEKEQKLKEAYQFDDYLNYSIEYSKVLFRNIYNFTNEITIYKGKDYHLQENNLVVNKDGLVGVIHEVNDKSSQVYLLNNENSCLSVKINSYYGILKNLNNELIVEGLNNQAEIEIGDLVTTSDLSIYPENILIGKVKNIQYDTYEIEKILTIEPAVDFNAVSYVGVITDLRGAQ